MSELRLNRRLLLTAGSGVLGVTVLNSLTGCTKAQDTPDAAGTGPAATSAGPSSSAAAPAASGNVTGDWRRVDLDFVSVYLLIRGGEVAVVDTGNPGSAASVEEVLKAAGLGWGAVKHIILTHQHQDHAGGLAEIAPLVGATLYAGTADVAGIGAAGKSLTGVQDGDEVFGLQMIGTPGHTLGHVSIFEPQTGVLVAGDALRNQNVLEGSAPQYTADAAQAAASVKKLATLDVRAILPGHGKPITSGAREALQKLAATL
jgi:glyoxylase-like metal-dependent hydrolase (beta-lactamase superfamily II)